MACTLQVVLEQQAASAGFKSEVAKAQVCQRALFVSITAYIKLTVALTVDPDPAPRD